MREWRWWATVRVMTTQCGSIHESRKKAENKRKARGIYSIYISLIPLEPADV